MRPVSNNRSAAALAANRSPPPAPPTAEPKKGSCLSEIQRLQRERDERRRDQAKAKADRAAEEQRNRDAGMPGDVDFQRMIQAYRNNNIPLSQPHREVSSKITICIRKRPISQKEVKRFDYDSVSCSNPLVIVHDCKLKVDGISKYLDNQNFEFDHTFGEEDETEDIYMSSVQPLIGFVLGGGRGTVFAYGQTGSGKTYTMQDIQRSACYDLFAALESSGSNNTVEVSYFEIYGGRCQDLLNSRQRLVVREDGSGEVVLADLMETSAYSAEELSSIIDTGNANRTTHATESNDVSSRSHAVCQITLRDAKGNTAGRLTFIDLAGSERAADSQSHNRSRRLEGAEINKSLLALKECIRALDNNNSHVPYRASKLTLVLKDSFVNKLSKTVMIATISPAASSADHTINTLRYADRIKERVVGGQAAANAKGAGAAAIGGGDREDVRRAAPKDQSSTPPPGPSAGAASAAAGRGAGAKGLPSKQSQQQEQEAEEDDLQMALDDELADEEFHKTVQDIFDEEEELLNVHMSVIQENAELLTEEGRLLQSMQGESADIDRYASRLDAILTRKAELVDILKQKLAVFRKSLQKEEVASKKMALRKKGY